MSTRAKQRRVRKKVNNRRPIGKIEKLEQREVFSTSATLAFSSDTLFGGSGDQSGTDVAIHGNELYISGRSATDVTSALALSYELSTANSGTPSLRWQASWPPAAPSRTAESFEAAISSDQGVFFPGLSTRQTADGVGDRERKGIVVKFNSAGPDGADVGGADWISRPHFFPYRGYEFLTDGILVQDANDQALYVVGGGEESGFGGDRALVSRLNPADGSLVWKRKYASAPAGDVVAGTSQRIRALANGATWHNGFLYVAGYDRDARSVGGTSSQGMLLKVDAADEPSDPNPHADGAEILSPVWVAHTGFDAVFSSVAAIGDMIYVAGQSFITGTPDSSDYLLQKYDESGTLLWSRVFGGSYNDQLTDVIAVGDRLLAVGFTESQGSGGRDMVIMEMDTDTGETLATALYGGPLDDWANAVVANGNDVYVVGESRSFTHAGNLLGESDVILLHYRLETCASGVRASVRGGDLVICGTSEADRISITASSNGGVLVRLNGQSFGPFEISGAIVALAGDGDDVLTVTGVPWPVEFHGGPGDDYLAGGSLDDELFGDEGNDRLLGGEGNNRLDGGPGDDRLVARDGDDILLGGPGNDVLQGGAGLNFLDGGEGDDLLSGGLDDDVLLGGAGNDTLSGYLGNDILVAGLGNDQLMGSDGRDVLFAGAGRDSLRAGAGNDLLVSNRSQLDGLAAADFEQSEQLDAALRSILADWQRDVFDPDVLLGDDDDEDDLLGELGADWFFAADKDRVRDLRELQGDRVS